MKNLEKDQVVEDWKLQEERQTGIGGSDVAACFGVERGCTRRLVYEKRGEVPDYPNPELAIFERGKALEDDAIEKYQRERGERVIERGALFQSEDYPHMICHVDGLIAPKSGKYGLLEVKTVNKWALNRARKNGLSESYILQMQHMFFVTGAPWGEWALLCPDPWSLYVTSVARDEGLIQQIVDREQEVWKMVTDGPLPDKLDPTDPRCQVCPFRRTCQGEEIRQAWSTKDEDKMELESDLSLDSLAQEVFEAQELAREANELKDEAVAKMKAAIGSRDGVIVTGARFILSRSWPQRWDTAALKASLKEIPLLGKFLKDTPRDKPVVSLRTYKTGD